ncbi:isoprenyl transferase [Mesorhizobium sp. RP14(2022)]|uniref:Isoprenyl transferase n=1 Tax=Mesorhizobium liriopis TaxID=2953882 RepID=A0ABT1C6W6_9HYPH|nr:isoprenyl transferase [Mesorhizobium liriopis]
MTSPSHVAIIMDGNGRWAKARGLPRLAGHRAGVEALRRTVRAAGDLGIEWLTVYAFSSENWSRPEPEVSGLMGLLKLFIRRDLADLHAQGVRIRVIGDREGVPSDIRHLLEEAEALTANNRLLKLVIAFNYGGRDEIIRAVKKVAQASAQGLMTADTLTHERFAAFMDTAEIPDPDLVIRTSGEMRLSNFLLWQAAYSEFAFLPCYWPDFSERDLREAIEIYGRRERRFGGLVAQDAAAS